MRAKEYHVMRMAVEDGVKCGWQRAHKHDPEPPDDRIIEQVVEDVTASICEWFLFDDAVES